MSLPGPGKSLHAYNHSNPAIIGERAPTAQDFTQRPRSFSQGEPMGGNGRMPSRELFRGDFSRVGIPLTGGYMVTPLY